MKKYILHNLYSTFGICGMSLLLLCAACTEQDELPSADPQPLTIAISETVPFVKATKDAHTRIADSGTALTWENGDKIYLAATITINETTTYAYSTATYTGSGSTGTWSALSPDLSAPIGSTVRIEALYAKGTLSNNTLTLAENSIVTYASVKDIAVTSAIAAIPLKFQSLMVRFEVTGISAQNPVASRSFNLIKSVDVQPANGIFNFGTATETTTVMNNGVYYLYPGTLSLATANRKSISIVTTSNQSYFVNMGPDSGNISPDGNIATP